LAPETDEYEFIVRTDHAVRLWINSQRKEAIDAWVKSGNDTEYKTTMFLLAGHAYSLKLEFSKGTQGVKDKDKEKKPIAKAFVSLLGKRPSGEAEVIPARCLSPVTNPEAYVCSVPFPPDDRSYGWERGATISKEWDQATTDAAIDAAGYIAGRLNEFSGTKE